jgi:phosphoribosylglycinamide formyltransferase 1
MSKEISGKTGVICSAGGGAFFSAVDMLCAEKEYRYDDFYLIVDRDCAAEKQAQQRCMPFTRIVEPDKQCFSAQAAEKFQQAGCDCVIMLFSRLVSSDLFSVVPTLNIHPALLPAFKGIGAVNQAYKACSRFLGATLHSTNDELDGGDIIAQVVTPLSINMSIEIMNRISYVQKSYLTLCAVDLYRNGVFEIQHESQQVIWRKLFRMTPSACPALCSEKYTLAFSNFQRNLGVDFIVS